MRHLIPVTASLAAASLVCAASAQQLTITGCNLGITGSNPITCVQTDVHLNQQVRIELSQPLDLFAFDAGQFTIRDLVTGASPNGTYFVDGNAVVFNASVAIDATGTIVSYGFSPGRSYRILVPGTDSGPGNYLHSMTGQPNTTTLDCVVDATLRLIEGPPFCEGDASAGCPCGGNTAPDHGCPNSRGSAGGRLHLFEQQVVAPGVGRFWWVGANLTVARPVVLMRSSTAASTGAVFGDGVLCLTGGIVRIDTRTTFSGWTAAVEHHHAGPGTFHYQLWVRDDSPVFCTPAAFGVTNAASLVW